MAAAESRGRHLPGKPIARAGRFWETAVSASQKYFPTEDLSSLLRPLIRDSHRLHDGFNLLVLPRVVQLCLRFWNDRHSGNFLPLAVTTYAYFAVDMVWVLVKPDCVKSPSVIVGHHILTMLYMLLPLEYPELRPWMALCLLVEVNTFFLILRRLWHVPPVSVCFYVTWFGIRLGLYPWLVWRFWLLYWEKAHRGKLVHPFLLLPLFQALLTLLNVKWTVDLVRRKLRTMRDPSTHGVAVSKGL